MFSHITIGSNDLARTKAFYDAPFAATGGEPGFEDAKRRLIYATEARRPTDRHQASRRQARHRRERRHIGRRPAG